MLAGFESAPLNVALAATLGYLLGSIPFGLLFTRLVGFGDIRNIGSGSIGATNVLRTGNLRLALLTLIFDSGKGAAPTLAIGYLAPDLTPLAAIAAVLGHLFPIWLGFKGGKGYATALGVVAVLAWPVALLTGLTWLLVAAIFRFSSLSTLVSITLAPLYAWIWGEPTVASATAVIAVFLWLRHRQNIQRLRTGEEPKIGEKAQASPS